MANKNKIAIINDYDSQYGFSIYLDGIIIEHDTILGCYYTNQQRVIKKEYKILARKIYYIVKNHYGDKALKELLSDYDKIIYCVDGEILAIK